MSDKHATRRTRVGSGRVAPALALRARDSAQDAWLAGLNVIAKAQDDAVRLVDAVTGVTERISDGADRIGKLIGHGAGSVLGHAGLASRKDLEVLSRRVSKLAREVEKLATLRKAVARSGPNKQDLVAAAE